MGEAILNEHVSLCGISIGRILGVFLGPASV